MRETGIVFYFENFDKDVWSGRKLDLDAWNYGCKVAGIKKAIIVNKSHMDVRAFDRSMDIQVVDELPKLEGHVTQLVCPWEDTPSEKVELWDFDHETDWYVFGPASGWVKNHFGDSFVTIPQNGRGAHHSVFIANTVMYHRFRIKGE
jgi:hypothetical protein